MQHPNTEDYKSLEHGIVSYPARIVAVVAVHCIAVALMAQPQHTGLRKEAIQGTSKNSARRASNTSAITVSVGKKSPNNQTISNLRAFAKLYGYVRYFHPSDEASAVS